MDESLTEAFNAIYHSFNQNGRFLTDDRDRHPEYTRQLLNALDAPDDPASNIMVTGSKGKGSTAYFIARLLESKTARVGLFTSPELLDGLERIRLNGRKISPENFLWAFSRLKPHLEAILPQLQDRHYIGPVGLYAVLAALWFRHEKVGWAVWETGRGARFDDVAQVKHVAAIITTVLAEHVRELGGDISSIAWHKAGVISADTTRVVLGNLSDQAIGAVRQQIQRLGTRPQVIRASDYVAVHSEVADAYGTTFGLSFRDGRRWDSLRLPALGPLAENLAWAIAVVESLAGRLDETSVRHIAKTAHWPGRGEIVSRAPYVLLDAAVQPVSLAGVLKRQPRFDVAVLSIPDGKDRVGMVELVGDYADTVILTDCSNPRLVYHLDDQADRSKVVVIRPVQQALQVALTRSSGDRVLLAGTISFVADVYRYYNRVP